MREIVSVDLASTTAPAMVQSAAVKAGPIAVAALGVMLALLLSAARPATLGGALLAVPTAGFTANVVVLLLATAAAGGALRGVRTIKCWLDKRKEVGSAAKAEAESAAKRKAAADAAKSEADAAAKRKAVADAARAEEDAAIKRRKAAADAAKAEEDAAAKKKKAAANAAKAEE